MADQDIIFLAEFRHPVKEEGSITLGSNTEDASVKEANAYIVFVNATPPSSKTNATEKAAAKNEDQNTDTSQ